MKENKLKFLKLLLNFIFIFSYFLADYPVIFETHFIYKSLKVFIFTTEGM